MPQPINLDLYAKHIFSDVPAMNQAHVPEYQQKRIIRVRELYSYWNVNRSLTEKEMVSLDMQRNPEVQKSQAWNDIHIIKELLGQFNKDSKAWHQYLVNKELLDIYHKAKDAGDFKSAEKALADYAKYNRLDKEDETPDNWWENIVPELIEPTDDPTVIGIAPVKDIRNIIKQYNKKYKAEAIDASYEEVKEAAKDTGELREEDEG